MSELAAVDLRRDGRASGAVSGWQGVGARRRIAHSLLHVFLFSFGFAVSLPLFWVVSTSFKAPAEVFQIPIRWIPSTIVWANYPQALTRIPAATFAVNTSIIMVASTILTLIFASMVAYSLARLRWPGRDLVFALVVMTMMLPGVVTLVPAFIVFRMIGWIDTFLPLIIPSSTAGAAFYIFLIRQYFMGLPYELEEAARIDGATTLRIWWQLMLPLSGPVLAATAIFSMLHHYNDFMWPMIVLSSMKNYTLALGLRFFVQQIGGSLWPLTMALSALMLLPVIVIFFVAQRHFIRGIHLTGLAGR